MLLQSVNNQSAEKLMIIGLYLYFQLSVHPYYLIILSERASLFILNISFLGTPGRLNDLIMNDILNVRSVTYLVNQLLVF